MSMLNEPIHLIYIYKDFYKKDPRSLYMPSSNYINFLIVNLQDTPTKLLWSRINIASFSKLFLLQA